MGGRSPCSSARALSKWQTVAFDAADRPGMLARSYMSGPTTEQCGILGHAQKEFPLPDNLVVEGSTGTRAVDQELCEHRSQRQEARQLLCDDLRRLVMENSRGAIRLEKGPPAAKFGLRARSVSNGRRLD